MAGRRTSETWSGQFQGWCLTAFAHAERPFALESAGGYAPFIRELAVSWLGYPGGHATSIVSDHQPHCLTGAGADVCVAWPERCFMGLQCLPLPRISGCG